MRHGLFALTIGLIPLLAAQTIAADTTPKRPPNILFILADDVGREVLGCYGGTSYATPNLDRLAAGGIRFEHTYSMPVCHPTRICLLTGRYPLRLGNPGWGSFPASAASQSLAHPLKQAGYATAISGKWQLTRLKRNPQHPHQLGFDDYCLFGWHEGPRYYQPLIWQNAKLRPELAEKYGPDVYTDFLIDFMEKNRERPFFAFYSMALCHAVSNDFKVPVPLGPKGRYDSYKEMAEGMDERVGRLVAALERLGLREQTLVLYSTDNGTQQKTITTAHLPKVEPPKGPVKKGKRGKLVQEAVFSSMGSRRVPGGKGRLTDGGTRVPTIANWPGTIAPGQIGADLMDFSDFLPTFAELAGASLPAGVELDGKSFAARLRDGTPGPRTWAFAQGKNGKRFFVRTQRYKLYSDGLFFDAATDPEEKHPIDTTTAGDVQALGTRHELKRVVKSLQRLLPAK